jgi:hypothetical protein
VEVHVLHDAVHGFFPMVTQLQRADDAVQLIGKAVQKACRPPESPDAPERLCVPDTTS